MSMPSTSPSPSSLRPIILVTGANSGLGFATCQRLLLQLSSPLPTDTLPIHPSKRSDLQSPLLPTPFQASSGCTLLLACRNAKRAQNARDALYTILDRLKDLPDEKGTPTSLAQLQKWGVTRAGPKSTLMDQETQDVKGTPSDGERGKVEGQLQLRRRPNTTTTDTKEDDHASFQPRLQDDVQTRDARARGEYRRGFCNGTRIEIVSLDLGSMASICGCIEQVTQEQPYLTHLILNAGGGAFDGIDWPMAIWMTLTRLKMALTRPVYKLQRNGDISADGLGWVWQINVGGSWALTQGLLPLMRKSPYSTPPRIIFTSSIEAIKECYDPQDPQCLRTDVHSHSYESTKYQCDLAALALQEQLDDEAEAAKGSEDILQRPSTGGHWTQPDVFCTHPGVVATSIMADSLNTFTAIAMLWALYLARLLLSPHHLVTPYKGSLAHSFVALAPLSQLACDDPSKRREGNLDDGDEEKICRKDTTSTRYASQCDIWGREYIGFERIDGWWGWQVKSDPFNARYNGPSGDEENEHTNPPRSGGEEVRKLARQWRRMTEQALASLGPVATIDQEKNQAKRSIDLTAVGRDRTDNPQFTPAAAAVIVDDDVGGKKDRFDGVEAERELEEEEGDWQRVEGAL